jgi:hydrogenase expression/formation protein HypE
VAVAPERSEECLDVLRQGSLCQAPLCLDASIIGRVVAAHPGMVGMRTRIGGLRYVDMPTGEILPRIC